MLYNISDAPLLPANVTLERMKQQVLDRIDQILSEYPNLKVVYALFSGGDDSTVLAWLASHHPKFKGVMFANTLTGDIETIKYVRRTAKEQGWEFREVKPLPVDRFQAMLAMRGWMGPAMHRMVYSNLKGKPFDRERTQIAKDHKCRRQDVLFVTGVRRAESQKRERTVNLIKVYEKERKNKHKGDRTELESVWGAPLFDWQRSDLETFFQEAKGQIERNWHAYEFGASRECGCKTAEGLQDPIIERERYPVYWQRRQLQRQLARAAWELQEFELENGLIDPEDATIPPEGNPDSKPTTTQMSMFSYIENEDDSVDGMPFLCIGCENKVGQLDPDRLMWGLKKDKVKDVS